MAALRSITTGAVALLALALPAAAAQRALVIGIDRYTDQKLDIGGSSSTNDVLAMLDLIKSNAYGYSEADILVLTDGDATRQAILDGIRTWLLDGTKPGDRILFYYSGLGHFEKDKSGDEPDGLDETLVPVDAVVVDGDPPGVTGAILDDEMIAMFRRLAGRKGTILIDAGHSGLVSSGQSKRFKTDGGFRVASLGNTVTRSIVVEPAAKAQKTEGAPIETDGLPAEIAVITATSGGQTPIVEGDKGTFTEAVVAGLKEKEADTNKNGVVSNAEILDFARDKSKAACDAKEGCELGLTPTLNASTSGEAALAVEVEGESNGKLTPDKVLDFFAKGNTHGVILEQIPPSPVHVGAKNIRFKIVSPTEGNLILLDLSDDGTLTQLFPNGFVKGGGREGHILAGSPIVVPDDYYGISFNATSPTSGTLIAIVTNEPIELPKVVTASTTAKTRKIEVIPHEEATKEFLPAIAAALEAPADAGADTATRAVDWSVATLRYEIVQ
jgi:hypothetical protein